MFEGSIALIVAAAASGVAISTVVWLLWQQRQTRRLAQLEAELDVARRTAEEQRTAAAQTQAQLRDTFSALSREALKDNAAAFLQTADQTLRARQDAIDALLTPMRETLTRVQTQLVDVDRSREGSSRQIAQHLSSLSDAQKDLQSVTAQLSRSLRSPNVRGVWGEIQLRRVVELAGMLQYCDFIEKESATTEQGARQIPDLVVKLPGGTSLVVDSKVPIDAYLKAADTSVAEDARAALLVQHARQVREHIRSLGAKEYWKQFQPSPEIVVMFLPLEPLMAAAFEQDGTLLEMAASLRVIPATPMTLLAILRAVASSWGQQQLATNAEELQQIGRELYERLATMVGHLERVGLNIKQAADSYDRFIGSLEQNVLPGARKFKELGVSSTKELEVPERLNLSIRRVSRPELTSPPQDDVAEPDVLPLLKEE